MIGSSTVADDGFKKRLAQFRLSAAAILHEEGKHAADTFEIGEVADGASFPLIAHKPGSKQDVEIGGHCVLANVHGFSDLSRMHTICTRLDQQTQNLQPCHLAECGEG